MDPLDLTKAPPRTPRSTAGELSTIMVARSIDKYRATLPGGNLGEYKIEGFTIRMLENLGLDGAEFQRTVANAAGDADVVAWVKRQTTPEQRAASDQKLSARTIADRADDPAFFVRHPVAKTLPLETALIDMLAKDDEASFA